MSKTAVGLCDQSQLFREGLQSLLRSSPFVVTGSAGSLNELLDGRERTPEIVICGVETIDELESDIASRNLKEIGAPRVVLLTNAPSRSLIRAAAELGVQAVLSKNISGDVLQRALGLVILGQTLFPAPDLRSLTDSDDENEATRAASPVPARRLVPHLHLAASDDQDFVQLSDRESQILRCLVDGLPNKLIARDLTITEATVKVHIKGLLRKLRVSNRTQAAVWGMNNPYATALRAAPVGPVPDAPPSLRLAT